MHGNAKSWWLDEVPLNCHEQVYLKSIICRLTLYQGQNNKVKESLMTMKNHEIIDITGSALVIVYPGKSDMIVNGCGNKWCS